MTVTDVRRASDRAGVRPLAWATPPRNGVTLSLDEHDTGAPGLTVP